MHGTLGEQRCEDNYGVGRRPGCAPSEATNVFLIHCQALECVETPFPQHIRRMAIHSPWGPRHEQTFQQAVPQTDCHTLGEHHRHGGLHDRLVHHRMVGSYACGFSIFTASGWSTWPGSRSRAWPRTLLRWFKKMINDNMFMQHTKSRLVAVVLLQQPRP